MTDPATVDAAPAAVDTAAAAPAGFQVRLANFTGPFDLLLQLIGKHKLDVTEVALHTVTDDFISYIRAMGDAWDLDEASEFLVIAATLLDLKAARLLPSATVENEEDLALLEARDLLFARLLQYKAFKEAAAHIAGLESIGSRRYPRSVSLEPQYAEALPDLVLGVGPARLLKLALRAFAPKADPPLVSIAHIHMVRVSVREHANIVRDRLIEQRHATFSALCIDCESTLEVVARFLALLELYREDLVSFEQVQALGELIVRWIGPDDAAAAVIEVEEYEGSPAPVDTAATPVSPELSVVDTPDLDDIDPDDADPDALDLDALALDGAGLADASAGEVFAGEASAGDASAGDVGADEDEADVDVADSDVLSLDDAADPDVSDPDDADVDDGLSPGESNVSVEVGQEPAGPAGIDPAEVDSEVDQ